jgi:hypothetical protein
MVPGLPELLAYQLAAERLHETPFRVVTFVTNKPEETCAVLHVWVNHVLHIIKGRSYSEVHDRAVKAFVLFNRLDRIRGLA